MATRNWFAGIVWGVGSLATAMGMGQAPIYRIVERPMPAIAEGVYCAADLDGNGTIDLVTETEILLGDGTGHFRRPCIAPPFLRPKSVVAADFNGDGLMDLAAIPQLGNGVVVAYASPGFAYDTTSATTPPLPALYPSFGAGAVTLAAGDVNGDGRPDLVMTTEQYLPAVGPVPGRGAVWLNVGPTTFVASPTGLPQTGLPTGRIALSDLDNDGDLDILFSPRDVQGGTAAVIAINTAGSFSLTPIPGTGAAPIWSATLGNFNNDVFPDLIIAERVNSWSQAGGPATLIYGPLTSPVYGPSIELGPAEHIVALDVNSDQRDDILVFGDRYVTPSIEVHPMLPNGNFAAVAQVLTGFLSASLLSGAPRAFKSDVDGDGDKDVVCALAPDYTPAVLFNSGTGQIAPFPQPLGGLGDLTNVFVGNVDQDGIPDLFGLRFIAPQLLVTGRNDGDGYFTPGPSIALPQPIQMSFISVGVFDADGDGDSDVLVPYQPTFPWLTGPDVLMINNGTSFTSTVINPAALGRALVATTDVDGDGDVDIIASPIAFPNLRSFSTEIMLNNGSAGFGVPQRLGPPGNTTALCITDVNGDGLMDIWQLNSFLAVAPVNFPAQSYVYLRTGPATFNAVATPITGYTAVAGDLNGDGLADVIVDAVVYFGNGAGQFTPGPPLPIGQLYQGQTPQLCDLDNDGDLDLILDGATIFINNGAGTFTAGAPMSASPYSIGWTEYSAFADFDRDQDIDIISPGPMFITNCTRQLAVNTFPRPGGSLKLDVLGAPGDQWNLYFSLGAAQIQAPPFGTVFIDPTTAALAGSGVLGASGSANPGASTITFPVPYVPGIAGIFVHAQDPTWRRR